ncbi:MAG: FAD-dependent oxidoreductase [bacterium]|nr:FAD-dependent oxidoreductase [bacterium]
MFIVPKKKKVVIVGAGFAGVALARKLLKKAGEKFSVVLIDGRDYHLFKPALYKAVASSAGPASVFSAVTMDFGEIFKNKSESEIEVIHRRVRSVSLNTNSIILSRESEKTFWYDYLVLALGAEPNFENVSGSEGNALPLATYEDALKIKHNLENLIKNKPKHRIAEIVIIGGGFIGCEFAASLAEFGKVLAESVGQPKESIKISLIEVGEKLMKVSGGWLSEKTEKRLRQMGVQLFLKKPISFVKQGEIIFAGGSSKSYDILIWAGGSKPTESLFKKKCEVSDFLNFGSRKNIFAIGDFSGKGCIVPDAIEQAKYIAKVLVKAEKKSLFGAKKLSAAYKPAKKKFVLSLGRDYGLTDLGFVKLKGKRASFLKDLIFLNYFRKILPWRKAWAAYKKLKELE